VCVGVCLCVLDVRVGARVGVLCVIWRFGGVGRLAYLRNFVL